MYKNYNMTQLTLPIETSVRIPQYDNSRYVNEIVETIPDSEFDEFICPNNKRIGFKRYAYRNDRYSFKRDFKLYECDDCSACSLRQQCMKPNSKSNKKIMKNYNWEYFKAQINQKLSEPETKKIYNQRKIDVEPVFGFMKAILGFTRMSVRGINKVKRELGFVLMALNIRKTAAQRAVHYKIHIKKADFY
ncbi:transposase DDE domain protein [Staphylococcus aureus]|uniref:Transposase DDE domain protein n=1 Tax=Staphylococcus aureus TaxID=1280 RepID=A0A8G2HW76_STAAU|nr:transposase, IS4 family [Staphylococcus aureus subsp. aureus 21204]CAC6085993.1 transposase DDE domain protein [Staphylococcus aureus]SUK14361.1 transposase DDE domain protein [Staphylococcus aureus]SUK44297.1 transposase DDE domain protein [Staphylococcus aureus]SUK53335.1 transposase DDE domain protein [Staphylococcus aureus]